MKADTWVRLDGEFRDSPIMCATDRPTLEEIDSASNLLGVAFVADYRDFLRRYGGAIVGPYPIFGLRPADVMGKTRWSVVDVNRQFRSSGLVFPSSYVIFAQDHAGNPVAMDGEGVVWIHDHDFGGIAKLASSFEEYIRVHCLKLKD